MPTSRRDVEIARRERETKFEPNHRPTWGTIAEVDGSTSPINQPNLTWVDELNISATRKKYLNPTTLNTAGAVVELGPDTQPPYRKIIGPWTKGLPPGSTTPLNQFSTSNHAPNHQWPTEATVGEDAIKIYQPAWQPLKTTGNGVNLTVETQPLNYTVEGTRKVFPGASTDLTSYVPGAGLVRRILIYLDENTNTRQVLQGTAVTNNGAIPIPYPVVPSGMRGSAWVKLANGQTSVVTATHIDDARDTADSANSGRFVQLAGDAMTGALTIQGSEDTPQLTIQGNAAQTTNVLLVEQNGGTDLLTLSNAGQMALPVTGVNGGLVLGGDVQLYRSAANVLTIPDSAIIDGAADAVQLTIQGHSTQTNNIILAERSDGTDLLTLANAGQLGLPITGSGGGIRIGGDVDLYRGAANQLDISDSTVVTQSQNAGTMIKVDNPNTGSAARALFRLTSDTITADMIAFPAAAAGGARFNFQAIGGPLLIVTSDAYQIDFYSNNLRRLRIDSPGNVVMGAAAALATTATDGFFYDQSCAGAPTGTPTAHTGRIPTIVDTTNLRVYFYIAGTWRYAALT